MDGESEEERVTDFFYACTKRFGCEGNRRTEAKSRRIWPAYAGRPVEAEAYGWYAVVGSLTAQCTLSAECSLKQYQRQLAHSSLS